MKKFLDKKYLLFSLPFLFLFAVIFPKLLGHGMFLDGVLYAAIARNLSQNIGTFWEPHYAQTLYPSFFEHPALSIYIQSILFDIFGDTRWVEKGYTFVLSLLQLFLVIKIWKNISKEKELFWAPALIFIITPVVFWTMANNELENTLLVFTLSSTLFIIRGCRAKHNIEAIFCGLISAVFIILAFLSKGVFALYPLVFPFFCYFFLENANKKKAIACQISLLFSTLILFIPFILNESSYNFFKIYFEQQVYRSLSGHREVDNPHFEIFIVLLKEIIVPISLCFVIVAFSKSMKLFNFNRTTVLYFFMALAASLPLVISSKNHGWYLMISMPFYALAIASLFINYLIEFKDWCIRTRGGSLFLYSLVISLSCVAIILSIRNYNRVLKNAQYHNDFTMQGKMLLENTVISFFPQWLRGKGETWMMLGNFARDYKISLSLNPNLRFRLFLVNDPEAIEVPKGCRLFFPKNPKEFAVYDCIEDSSMSLLSENNEILLNSEAQT
ncbi:ArnT family glycosyltransferase [Fluviispira sanaruensis]|nr:glycosyltransferase family 39 protein [Fluviispira sanaruensis]